jgi:hypothetical protein
MTTPCADCDAPATGDQYAGWVCIGGRWIPMTRPLCDFCAGEDARARAEARAS